MMKQIGPFLLDARLSSSGTWEVHTTRGYSQTEYLSVHTVIQPKYPQDRALKIIVGPLNLNIGWVGWKYRYRKED